MAPSVVSTAVLRWSCVLVIALLQLGGFGLFARGFFPTKIVQPGQATYQAGPNTAAGQFPAARFDRLIVVVIDALRSDFVFANSSSFGFVHDLIRSGSALPFTAHSSPPTVTLPRIKGLTTGSTPNFLDAILNIAESDTSSTLANQDSWVLQLHSAGKTLHMFGDDTWIKLFPGLFSVSDGTASFFVSDFTEVDNNVTRHIDAQMAPEAGWDALILHYLGLDHIGHKGGPDSVFMPTKQREMDTIISRVYNAMDQDTLLVVCGDHGMNEAGNHGGSSSGETSAAMVLASPKFSRVSNSREAPLDEPTDGDFTYYQRIQQTDLVPSLAALLGFPIPKNSLGVAIRDLLPLWDRPSDQVQVLNQNVRQMVSVLESTHGQFSSVPDNCTADLPDLETLQCIWHKSLLPQLSNPKKLDHAQFVETAYDFLDRAQGYLSRASTNYNDSDMLPGLSLLIISAILSVLAVIALVRCSGNLKFVLILISGLYAASMFGSSLVEEEHHFWYWGATGWLSWLYITSSRRRFRDGINWIICLVVIRLIRGWNQTGQKYAGAPDFAKWLSSPEDGGPFLWVMIVLCYGSLFGRIWQGNFTDLSSMAGFVFSFTTVVASFAFKVHMATQAGEYVPQVIQWIIMPTTEQEKVINLARLSFFTVGIAILYELSKLLVGYTTLSPEAIRRSKPLTELTNIVEVFLITQTRTHNIPLFIFFNILRIYLFRALTTNYRPSRDLVIFITIFTLILQHVCFFAMGGSNSLASVDLSNAYNGIGSYQIVLVGILTFVSNWIGPLYWSLAGLSMLVENDLPGVESVQVVLSSRILTTQMFFSIATSGVLGACFILKHHLFIWTVFSPKLLYSAAWLIIQNGLVDTAASIILGFILTRRNTQS